jgi:predicted transposase YbfD/YdcC
MAGKRGQPPAHVTKKQFLHPGIEFPFIQVLEGIEDPRKPSIFFRYSLTSVLFMTAVALMCGATDWPKVVIMSEGMAQWLAQYVDMTSGVPCERTFKDLFNLLQPEAMEQALREVSSQIRSEIPQETINFDGQTERGTADKHHSIGGLHFVHAWSSNNALCLGQLKVEDKSNEITAVPKLMESLDLKGTIITTDALNTQKATAQKAVESGADYVLPVKGNQPALLEEIISAFKSLEEEQARARKQWERSVAKARENRDEARLEQLLLKGAANCGACHWKEEAEKAHGRIETRSCIAMSAKDLPSKNGWESLGSIARVDRERIEGEKIEKSQAYYITSLEPNSAVIGKAARQHWGVETLHWRLDVIFKQDQSRYRNRVGARNLAVVRKLALNALLKEKSLKGGIATKQYAAACNPAYRTKVIKNLF